MKDANDKSTKDIFDKPRRGRPSTGQAKTDAQRMREYRNRQKIKPSRQTISTDELERLRSDSQNLEYLLLDLSRVVARAERKIAAEESWEGQKELRDDAYRDLRCIIEVTNDAREKKRGKE